jgi:2-polyprenyl-3-methyl-5-hydroxy-6-metoxy-1,4-benzoquinol methylase
VKGLSEKKTKEPQYQIQIETFNEKGLSQLGLMTSHIWRTDPRHLGFLLSRYKFCAKMLTGKNSVLEVGCGDGFGIPIVLQSVKSVHATDFDPLFIANAKQINAERTGVSFQVLDITKQKIDQKFDAVYSLDVIEHIDAKEENVYLSHICEALPKDGLCIIGTPNINSSQYASIWSQQGHINMKDEHSLRELLLKYFTNVFIFSMNDEVVHTGYYPMAHYLMAIAVGPRV